MSRIESELKIHSNKIYAHNAYIYKYNSFSY